MNDGAGSPTNEPTKRPKKVTLHDFVDDNYKLVTGMAAFVALTAFSSQIGDTETKTYLAGCALFAAGLFAMELFFRLPFNEQHWRLWLFQVLLLAMTVEIGRYSFLQFPAVWGLFVTPILSMVIFLGPSILLATVVDKVLKARTRMEPKLRNRVSLAVFAGSFVLLFILVQIKLGGHTISIPIPKFITDVFTGGH